MQLTNSGGSVLATVLAAGYWTGNVLAGFNFDTTPGRNNAAIATADNNGSYGCKSLTLALSPFTGGVTVSQGTVLIGNVNGAGTGPVTLNDANTGVEQHDLPGHLCQRRRTDSQRRHRGQPRHRHAARSAPRASIPAACQRAGPGTVTLNKATTFTGGNADRTTYEGVITGSPGTITVTGGARTTWDNTNTFTGNVQITTAGTILQMNGSTNVIPDASSVDVGAGTFLYSNNDSETIAGLSGTGTVQKHPGVNSPFALTVGFGDATSTFGGLITNGNNVLSLTKIGGGTLTLTNSANNYTGVTTYRGGIVSVPALTGGNNPSPIGAALGTRPEPGLRRRDAAVHGRHVDHQPPVPRGGRRRHHRGHQPRHHADPERRLRRQRHRRHQRRRTTDAERGRPGSDRQRDRRFREWRPDQVRQRHVDADPQQHLHRQHGGRRRHAADHRGRPWPPATSRSTTRAASWAARARPPVRSPSTPERAIAPGTTGTGIFNVGSSGQTLAFADSSNFTVQLGGTPPTDGSGPGANDQLNVVGTVTIGNNVALAVSGLSYTPVGGEAFVILKNDAADAIGGTFAGLPEGRRTAWTSWAAARRPAITYIGGDGNDVALVVDGAAVFTGGAAAEDFELRRITGGGVDSIQLLRGGAAWSIHARSRR